MMTWTPRCKQLTLNLCRDIGLMEENIHNNRHLNLDGMLFKHNINVNRPPVVSRELKELINRKTSTVFQT